MRRYFVLGGALALFLIDRFAKSWPFDLSKGSHGFFISLGRLENSGGVFSAPLPRWLLLVGAALALALLTALAQRAWRTRKLLMLGGASLMLVGGVSNVLDRLWGVGVVDLFQVGGGLSFNLADVYLLAGLVLLVL